MLMIYGPGGRGDTTDAALDIVLEVMSELAVFFEARTFIGPCSDVDVFCDCLRCTSKGVTEIGWQGPNDEFVQTAYVSISR